jgi:hypothetical protein
MQPRSWRSRLRNGILLAVIVCAIVGVTFLTSDFPLKGWITGTSTKEEDTSVTTVMINGEERVRRALSNPNATKEAVNLYNYLNDIYGNAILAGQQESTWINDNPEDEMEYIEEATGKLPAIRGLDYINEDFDGVTSRTIDWWEKGGIATICWHWGAPTLGVGYEASKMRINVNEALTEGTELYNAMVEDMDRVAEELKKLQEAGVPVLWRPFHELNGNWFWWSKDGADTFKRLWIFMYNRYTDYHGLNNLIWVFGYTSTPEKGWYPGNDYVDIAGCDGYEDSIMKRSFKQLKNIAGSHMPLVYHENGPIPNPKELQKEEVDWTWFMTWHTTFIKEENIPSYLDYVYDSDYVITLDELPDLKNYR